MPASVVDRLEIVDVRHQHREAAGLPPLALDFLVDTMSKPGRFKRPVSESIVAACSSRLTSLLDRAATMATAAAALSVRNTSSSRPLNA